MKYGLFCVMINVSALMFAIAWSSTGKPVNRTKLIDWNPTRPTPVFPTLKPVTLQTLETHQRTNLNERLHGNSVIHISRSSNELRWRPSGEFQRQSGFAVSSWAILHSETVLDAVKHVSRDHIFLVVADETDCVSSIKTALRNHSIPLQNIRLLRVAHHSPWLRGYGPVVLSSSDRAIAAIVDNQIQNHELVRDDQFPIVIAGTAGLPMVETEIVVDHSQLLFNGSGLVLASTRVLDQNPLYSKEKVESEIKQTYGADQVVFLESLDGDTRGQIDLVALMIDPFTVIVGRAETNADQANSEILDRNAQRLADTEFKGRKLKVIRLPMPTTNRENPKSYTGCVMADQRLLVPVFDDDCPNIRHTVLDQYRQIFPRYEIIAINAEELSASHASLRSAMLNLGSLPLERLGVPLVEDSRKGEWLAQHHP